ncbi:hypothetical protein P280DRAFT_178728 [Massarina eburnea CBS 473.64]|uniref:Uncharacterized protein n=1 Tax=Massarina eburnea CBS 473.64 TaxID=1395130 RepID=A0A6A6SCY8_9PLEO|nr:hypothetical protein P280DRAFT_178728 [Massarina eburnea CBS 473.64]
MAEPMSTLSPEKLNVSTNPANDDDDDDCDPPSSPFQSHIDYNNQENVAPTPVKPLMNFDDEPQSAFKVSPEKSGMKSAIKLAEPFEMDEEEGSESNGESRDSPRKSASPIKQLAMENERPGSAMSTRSSTRSNMSSPSRSPRRASVDTPQASTPSKYSHSSNNGPLAMEDTAMEDTEYNPDEPDFSAADVDDTCFSTFSEMPGIDMTKFAALRQSPTKNGMLDQTTPRSRTQMTPSTIRRTARTPSPTSRRSRKEGDTTNLLLDFTAQFEAFSTTRRGSPSRSRRHSPTKSVTQPDLLSYYNNQRSPGKGGAANAPATPRQHSRPMLNLLDFELPPAPTPRSVPTVTIRELESLKSSFQSQISSLTASLSGKEAQVESLVKAISDAERRVGESQEGLRDERSAREHAEAQMEEWKKKGEEVQNLLHAVQDEMARGESERDQILTRLIEAEKRTEEADQRASEQETRAIEAESKNVDMTTFINPDEDTENKKIYSEIECQSAIAEKVNEVARDLHAAYKAKHEKKIKALKESYQKKADERCKELRLQIIRLEGQVEEAEKRHDAISKAIANGQPATNSTEEICEFCNQVPATSAPTTSLPSDLKLLDEQRSELESLKAQLAGVESELRSLHASQASLLQDLEAERVEKGELVAAAEQMLAMCGEKMEEMQQEELRKSQSAPPAKTAHKRAASTERPAPSHGMRSTGFLAGGPASSLSSSTSSRPGSALGGGRPGSALGERGSNSKSGSAVGKPSGLRAPGGFGYGGGAAPTRSMSGNKSRILSNIERMGGGGAGGARGGQE